MPGTRAGSWRDPSDPPKLVTGASRVGAGALGPPSPSATTPSTATPAAEPPSSTSAARRGRSVSDRAGGQRVAAQQRALEVVGDAAEAGREAGEPGLDPALALDRVAADVADVDVGPGALGLLGRQLAVEQRAHAVTEVTDHDAPSGAITGPE